MNKILIAIVILVVVTFVTACVMKKSADSENSNDNTISSNTQTEQTDYLNTTEIPTETYEGVTDTAEPGYILINPNYDFSLIPSDKGPIEWFKSGLGSKIPPFPEGKLLEVINNDTQFVAYIANVSEEAFQKYFELLFHAGYTGEINTWEGFTLFNPQIAINLRYMQEPGRVTTIRARLLGKGEYEKMKAAIKSE